VGATDSLPDGQAGNPLKRNRGLESATPEKIKNNKEKIQNEQT
jgi:hypothetical protein